MTPEEFVREDMIHITPDNIRQILKKLKGNKELIKDSQNCPHLPNYYYLKRVPDRGKLGFLGFKTHIERVPVFWSGTQESHYIPAHPGRGGNVTFFECLTPAGQWEWIPAHDLKRI